MANSDKNLIRIGLLNKKLYSDYGFIGKQIFDKNGKHIGQFNKAISDTEIEIINDGKKFMIDLNNNTDKYFFQFMGPWESYLSIMESQGTNNLQNTIGFQIDVESHKDLKEFLGENNKPPTLNRYSNSEYFNIIKKDDFLGGKRQRKTKRQKYNHRTTKRRKTIIRRRQ